MVFLMLISLYTSRVIVVYQVVKIKCAKNVTEIIGYIYIIFGLGATNNEENQTLSSGQILGAIKKVQFVLSSFFHGIQLSIIFNIAYYALKTTEKQIFRFNIINFIE